MIQLSTDMHLWLKAFHVMSVIAWMAGLFYLPRLFIYHCEAEPGSDKSETFKVMERRLLIAIMNPAMIASWVSGELLVMNMGEDWIRTGWLHAKLGLVVLLTVAHVFQARWRREFAEDRNTRSHVFYRFANEVPTVLMIGIVGLAVVRPF